jgi:hypothetical protein
MIALAIGSTLNRTSFVAYAQLWDRHALSMLKGCFTDYTRSQAEKLEGGLLLARGWCDEPGVSYATKPGPVCLIIRI